MGCLRFTDGERERDDHREAKQKTRVVVVVVVTLSLFSPSKSFGAVERGGGRRQKARDLTFSFWIESIACRLPKMRFEEKVYY